MRKSLETHVLYEYRFYDGYIYFGFTNKENPLLRKNNHNSTLERGIHGNKLVQEHYNKTKQLPEFNILDGGDEYYIRCQEYYKVDEEWDNPKLLNTNKPWKPHIIKILLEEGFEQANKQYLKEYLKEYIPEYNKRPEVKERLKEYQKEYDRCSWNQTKLGRLSMKVDEARSQVKKYIKQEKWDLVEIWKIKEEESVKARQEYKNSEEYKEYKSRRKSNIYN